MAFFKFSFSSSIDNDGRSRSEDAAFLVTEIIVYNLVEGIFYAKLVCNNGDKSLEIDARTSDAIAIAVRFNCPIYTYEFILSTAGIILDESTGGTEEPAEKETVTKKAASSDRDLPSLSIEELKENLKKAIEDEAYEKASKIRDEINKRTQSQ